MCGVKTPQDKGVKDDSSIHVLKDVAISSGMFASLRMTKALHRHAEPWFAKAKHPDPQLGRHGLRA
jgi:hypothetical protein